jgi:N-acetylmuramic acid 6-phosphate etherase
MRGTLLALEGGGTKTTVLLNTGQRFTFGPLNLKLSTDRQILAILRQFQPARAALCLAGCRTAADRERVRTLAHRAWGNIPLFVGNDLDSGLAAAFGPDRPGILVISGTGSVVIGRNATGQTARAGGWGHLLGDHGSGYALALGTLRSLIVQYDRTGRVSSALQRVLRRLALNTPDQLVDWIHRAGKTHIAALLPEVINADPTVLRDQAALLAADVRVVARKLRLRSPDIVLAGGVFRHHPAFRRHFPGARLLTADTAAGGLRLPPTEDSGLRTQDTPLPLTEQRNPRTLDLDRRSIPQLVDTMLREEARVIPALRANRSVLVGAINTIVAAFRRGGRLFYVGAGTSGRLGVLDASECPPTFSTNPGMVQAIIAGGTVALHQAVEGAEDDTGAGAEAIRCRGVGRRDVVVGIAASGRTPFVLGALDEAKRRGAKTFLLCFSNPPPLHHSILLFPTGPEVLTGSTRLKAGTATKLVLNMLTTISMIRLGKVVSNLMVDVKPTNVKLRARAVRIVAALRGCSEVEARRRLARAGWNVKRAAGRRSRRETGLRRGAASRTIPA